MRRSEIKHRAVVCVKRVKLRKGKSTTRLRQMLIAPCAIEAVVLHLPPSRASDAAVDTVAASQAPLGMRTIIQAADVRLLMTAARPNVGRGRVYEQEEHQRAEHENKSRRQDWPARVGHHSRCTAQKVREVVIADEALQIQKGRCQRQALKQAAVMHVEHARFGRTDDEGCLAEAAPYEAARTHPRHRRQRRPSRSGLSRRRGQPIDDDLTDVNAFGVELRLE